VAELCLEVGDIPWEETGDCPEVYEWELDGVKAGVPEEFDCEEWVAIIGAVTCDEETWELIW
jgi:hypothetical protein